MNSPAFATSEQTPVLAFELNDAEITVESPFGTTVVLTVANDAGPAAVASALAQRYQTRVRLRTGMETYEAFPAAPKTATQRKAVAAWQCAVVAAQETAARLMSAAASRGPFMLYGPIGHAHLELKSGALTTLLGRKRISACNLVPSLKARQEGELLEDVCQAASEALKQHGIQSIVHARLN